MSGRPTGEAIGVDGLNRTGHRTAYHQRRLFAIWLERAGNQVGGIVDRGSQAPELAVNIAGISIANVVSPALSAPIG